MKRTVRAWTLLVLGGLALVGGCGESNPMLPASVVTGLRVLGVRAEPPEIPPLATAEFEVLAYDEDERELGYVFIVCDPVFEPGADGATFSACQDEGVLDGGEGLNALFTTGAARLIGTDLRVPQATYAPPVDANGDPIDILAGLAPDDPRRMVGGAVTLLALVAPLSDLVVLTQNPDAFDFDTLDAEMVMKRLTVSGRPVRNTNPVITGLTQDGTALASGAEVALVSGQTTELALEVSDTSVESFDYAFPDGHTETLDENLSVTWFGTFGRFTDPRSQPGEVNVYNAPGGETPPPDPTGDRVDFWVVVRDDRGGQSWTTAVGRIAP